MIMKANWVCRAPKPFTQFLKSAPSMLERIHRVKENNNKYEQTMTSGKKYEKLIEELKNETNFQNKCLPH